MVAARTRLTVLGRSFVGEVQSKRITFLAASLAYYAFVSLIPTVLLLFVAVSTLGGSDLAARVVGTASGVLSSSGQQLVRDAISNQRGAGGATVVSVVVLLWSALKVFRGLDIAFSQAYGRTAGGIVGQLLNGLVALAAVVVGLGVTIAVGALIALSPVDVVFDGVSAVATLGTLASFVAFTTTLLPLYYLLPGRDITIREALPGAAFTAVGWTALQTGFRIYAAYAGEFEAYGVIGGALLLVTWLYFACFILLLGVVLNAVLAGRTAEIDREHVGSEPHR
jgi:membrane protein